MKESPIIFSAPMVKAIQDGRKTQTRRIVDFGRFLNSNEHFKSNYKFNKMFYDDRKDENVAIFGYNPSGDKYGYTEWIKCPYGQVEDRLWVRESYRLDAYYDNRPPRDIPEGVTVECLAIPDAIHTEGNGHRKLTLDPGKWRPSIFMPKWATRIWLEITEVRMERVQEIDYFGARSEGILSFYPGNFDPEGGGVGYNRGATGLPMRYESTTAFMDLWDSINAKRGHGWDINDWVWVLTFKKEKK